MKGQAPEEEPMRVLLAIDGSESAWHALEEALRTLPLPTSDVHVVAVAPIVTAVEDPLAYGVAYHATYRDHREEAQRHLDEAVRALEAGGVRAHPVLRVGEPADEILAVAKQITPDLLVVGSHGRGPMGRFMLGSVSEAVVHRWNGAVLVVRKPPLPVSPGRSRTVASVMTAPAICADLDATVDEVAALMAEHDTGFVPLLRADRLAGVVTDRDLVVRVLAGRHDPATVKACEAATADVHWVTPDMPVAEAVSLMERHQIRRVVVLEGHRVVGVVSLGDLAETVPQTAEHALVEISRSPKTMAHGQRG